MSLKIDSASTALQEEIVSFWKGKSLQDERPIQVQKNGLPKMSLKVLGNELDSDCSCAARLALACWSDSEGVQAYAEAVMVGHKRPRQVLHAERFLFDMSASDLASYDFADLLVTTHLHGRPFEAAREGVRWLVDFRVLEVHPRRRGCRLGVRLGAMFLHELRARFPIGLFLLKPYPLQYSSRDGPREVLSAIDFPNEFDRDVNTLRRLYQEEWGAAQLPGSNTYLYLPGSTLHRLVASDDGSQWSLKSA